MTPVLMRTRAELRSRWKAWVSLTVLLGLFGGAVIAIAAGARRTDTAYQRFLAWSNAPDVLVPQFNNAVAGGVFGRVTPADVARLPQVKEWAHLQIYQQKTEASAKPSVSRVMSP